MPSQPIPFSEGQASGVEQLSGATPLAINAFADASRSIRCRPVVSTWDGFPATSETAFPIVAIGSVNDIVYCIDSRGDSFSIDGGVMTSLRDGTDASRLTILPGYRPIIAAFRGKVLAAGGGPILSWTGSGTVAELSSAAPLTTAIAGIATRVVASRSDASGIFQWSGLGDAAHATWDALNYAEAEAKPDVIKTLWDNTNEVYAFGADTLQVFAPDASAGFAPSRTINLGTLAPYSVIRIDDTFMLLDAKKRFVVTDGRSYQDKSTDRIGKTIEALTSLDDCWGFHLKQDQWDCCVWFFPTDGIGLVWDRLQDRWSEWRQWGANGWEPVSITSAYYLPSERAYLVGLSDGTIGKLDPLGNSEFGRETKLQITTGFLDRGTQEQKHCKHVWLRSRRGQTATGSQAPRLRLSYRDDNGRFIRMTPISLGNTGDNDCNIALHSLGVYRFRQWNIEYTGTADFVLVGAQEDFDIIGA